MTFRDLILAGLAFTAGVFVLLAVGGCGAGKGMLKDGRVSLKYAMPDGKVLKYRVTNGFTQQMDVGGRPISVTAELAQVLSVHSQGMREKDYRLAVTIDSTAGSLAAPQGRIPVDEKSILGRSFDMTLSSLGEEKDVSSAEPIEIDWGMGQKQDALSSFKAFFPNLPRRSVMVGDNWISVDTITEKMGQGEILIILSSTHRLDGFEAINGVKCAKVTAEVSGSITGKGVEGGMEYTTNMEYAGNDVWYFAPETGVFVKSVSTAKAKGEIIGTGARQMTIPMTRDYNATTELIR